MFQRHFVLAALVGTALSMASSATSHASINLEFRPFVQVVNVGDSFDVGFYAVSDDLSDQSIASIDLIMDWDPAFIQLTGLNNNGPYAWSESTFPDDSAGDDVNGTFADGNAFYRAFRDFPPADPAFATPAGLLVTTFTFDALALTPGTELDMLATFGNFSQTRVQDGEMAGLDVTGTLGSATIIILPEPSTILMGVLALGILRRRPRRV
ncbi:MAG TPA: hypothetical protein VNT79_02825 [Phycisphaerae bacterium]|nr:hypothetical protein [Phycisphaerae bacterium]